MPQRRFLFLQSSARAAGNSAALARLAAEHLPADTVQDWRDLSSPALPAFHDLRHGSSYEAPLQGPIADLAAATLAATDIVFVAPLYWRSPAPAKLYLDHWSHWLRIEEMGFGGRHGRQDIVAGDGAFRLNPAEIAPAAVEALRLSGVYLAMRWGGALLTDANAPRDWQKDPAAQANARHFFPA